MTNAEIQDTIDANSSMILRMANVAMRKLRRPNYIGLDDLIQEARIASMRAIRDHEKSPQASVKTYIFRHILHTMARIVKRSWQVRNDNTAYYYDENCKLQIKNSPLKFAIVQEFLNALTDEELEYVRVAASIVTSGRVVQVAVQRELGITWHQQKKYLDRIHKKAALIL